RRVETTMPSPGAGSAPEDRWRPACGRGVDQELGRLPWLAVARLRALRLRPRLLIGVSLMVTGCVDRALSSHICAEEADRRVAVRWSAPPAGAFCGRLGAAHL